MRSDESAEPFLRLFAAHQRQVYSYILTLVANHSDAEDVMQETCLILWRKFAEYQPGSSFPAWACRIAYLEVLRHRRVRKPCVGIPLSLLESLSVEALDRSQELENRYRVLTHCIERLQTRDRDLVRRRYAAGATIRSVANDIGRPYEGLRKAYQRIRRLLIACVDRALAKECV